MEPVEATQTGTMHQSRRHFVRNSAYVAPAIAVIGSVRKSGVIGSAYEAKPIPVRLEREGNNGFGNGADANTDAPGNSGETDGGKTDSVGDKRGRR